MAKQKTDENSKVSSDDPNLLKTDILIQTRLEEAGLVLIEAGSEEPKKGELEIEEILKDGVEFYKNELLKRNKATVIIFADYCLPSVGEIFNEPKVEELCVEQPVLGTLLIMFVGYIQAHSALEKGCIENKNWHRLITTLPGLFDQKEFKEIELYLKDLLAKFPEQLKKAVKWLKEDIEPANKQKEVLFEFVDFLQKNQGQVKENSPEMKRISQKVLDTCMPGSGVDNNHNFHTLKAREQLFMFSPDKQLLINIERIFTYLDVLSYAGIYPKDLPKNPRDLHFRKLVP